MPYNYNLSHICLPQDTTVTLEVWLTDQQTSDLFLVLTLANLTLGHCHCCPRGLHALLEHRWLSPPCQVSVPVSLSLKGPLTFVFPSLLFYLLHQETGGFRWTWSYSLLKAFKVAEYDIPWGAIVIKEALGFVWEQFWIRNTMKRESPMYIRVACLF